MTIIINDNTATFDHLWDAEGKMINYVLMFSVTVSQLKPQCIYLVRYICLTSAIMTIKGFISWNLQGIINFSKLAKYILYKPIQGKSP